MNIHYTGRQAELSDAQKKKLEPKFQKIQKILGNRFEPEAHVITSLQRHLFWAQVTLNFRHHTAVVECSGSDLFAIVQEALDKLEKQVLRDKDRWREKNRRAGPGRKTAEEIERLPEKSREGRAASPAGRPNGSPAPQRPASGVRTALPRILHTSAPLAKPLTVEEALLEMEQDDRDCVVYQDAENGRLAVLFRRRDGQLELIES